MNTTLCWYNKQLSILDCMSLISSIPLVRCWFHTWDPWLYPYILLRSLRRCVVLLPSLVYIPWGISMYMSISMSAWLKVRTNSIWSMLHPFFMDRTFTINMVNQVTTVERVLKNSQHILVYRCEHWDASCVWILDWTWCLSLVWMPIWMGWFFPFWHLFSWN